MPSEFLLQAAAQRYNELEAERAQHAANIAQAQAEGDNNAAADALEYYANTNRRLAELENLYHSQVAAEQQAQQPRYDPNRAAIEEAASICGLHPEDYVRGANYMYANGRYSAQQGRK